MGCSCIYGGSEDGEGVWLRSELLKSAKTHQCCECGALISKGELFHLNQHWWNDGGPRQIWTHKLCLGCYQLVDHFFCEGWTYGTIFQVIAEHLNETKPPPDLCCLDGLPLEAVVVFDKHVLPLLEAEKTEEAA